MLGRAAALTAALLASTVLVAPAADLPGLIAPYLAARERGAVGAVVGRAYEESRRPGGENTPYGAVSVLLLPRSPAFDSELAGIKAGWRDSPDRFVGADLKVREARVAFERDLLEAGGGVLIKGEMTDAGGAFRLAGVPEGSWMLLAWRESSKQQKTPPIRRSDAAKYPNTPELLGHTTVVYWLVTVEVKRGAEAEVRLHDRNEWLQAVREERRTRDPESRTAPGKQQGANPR
jgi:hypothetical protein